MIDMYKKMTLFTNSDKPAVRLWATEMPCLYQT